MKISGINVRRRLFVASGLVVIATGMWYYWTQARQQIPVAALPPPAPFVKLVATGTGNSDQVLAERAEYFDPTPLFIPTEWNFGQGPLPARVVRQPGQVFSDFAPNWSFNENNLATYAGGFHTEEESLPELLDRGDEVPFAGFGQVDSNLPPLPERAGYIEVKALSSGNLVMGENLQGLKLSRRDLAPVEFLTLVGSAGLVGEPVLTAGSGSEEVDNTVRDYLVKTYRLGDRLAPGQYVVSVGP